MAQWHAKLRGGYGKEATESKENAQMFYGVMYSLGWCLESVCAALGNQSAESDYNPWRWGGDDVLASDSPWIDQREPIPGTTGYYNHAYGLFQQDPAGKYLHRQYAMSLPTYAPNYINLAGRPEDGDAQCRYLHWICSQSGGGEWLPDASATYGMPFVDFYTNSRNKDIPFLVRTFFHCYERGTWDSKRVRDAEYWYDYLQNITPVPPTPHPTIRKLPLFFYLRYPF